MTIVKRLLGVGSPKRQKPDPEPLEPIAEDVQVRAFATGTGRCGTHFIARLMEKDPIIDAYHFDDLKTDVPDSFLRYAQWNNLPIDTGGFLHHREGLFERARQQGQHYFESNPYMSMSAPLLVEQFGAKIVMMVRNPTDTVNSHIIKGWYSEAPAHHDTEKALGYQYDKPAAHYFFGRFVPHGDEFERWTQMTQLGRIAWMWNTVNAILLDHIAQLPDEHSIVVKLETVDYEKYRQIHAFVGGGQPMTAEAFRAIRAAKPGKRKEKHTADQWSAQERREFMQETADVRERLGYDA